MANRLENIRNMEVPKNFKQANRSYKILQDTQNQFKRFGVVGLGTEHLLDMAKKRFGEKNPWLNKLNINLNDASLHYQANPRANYYIKPQNLTTDENTGRVSPHGIQIGGNFKIG